MVGDGCFQMTCGELTVARAAWALLPFVVLDDGWLSLIKVKQDAHTAASTAPPCRSPSLAPPAHYFGVPVAACETLPLSKARWREALQAPGPTVIEATVDPAHYSDTVYD